MSIILKSSQERFGWIDAAKALCMICVYLVHSFAFSGADGNYVMFAKPFYVNAFFFVSGFLFFRKWFGNDAKSISRVDVKKALANVVFRMVIPTILFSLLLYLPKLLFYNASLSLGNMAIDVLGGVSFWFTSALTVAQLAFLAMFFVFPKFKYFWAYFAMSVIAFVLCSLIFPTGVSISAREYFPWYWHTGLANTFLMALGGVYGLYYHRINKRVMTIVVVVATLCYFAVVIPASLHLLNPEFMGLGARINLSGCVGIFGGIVVFIYLVKVIRSPKWIEFIGKNSIVFYFFSGAIPAIVVTIISRFSNDSLLIAVFAFVASTTISYFVTKFIVKYLPFLVDLRLLFASRKK